MTETAEDRQRMAHHVELLKKFPALKRFPENELRVLAQNMEESRYKAGRTIVRQGSEGSTCFFVLFGKVQVLKELESGGDILLATVGPGSVLGQVSLLDGEPRSATCKALENTIVLELRRERYLELYQNRELVALRFQHLLSVSVFKQIREANERVRKTIRLVGEDHEAEDIFESMKGALQAVEEMGIDLDDVTYTILEGQKNDQMRARHERMRREGS